MTGFNSTGPHTVDGGEHHITADNVVHHPAFGNPPVRNPKTRGRPRGTFSLATARRKREEQNDLEQRASSARVSLVVLLTQTSASLDLIEVNYVKEALMSALDKIDNARRQCT